MNSRPVVGEAKALGRLRVGLPSLNGSKCSAVEGAERDRKAGRGKEREKEEGGKEGDGERERGRGEGKERNGDRHFLVLEKKYK